MATFGGWESEYKRSYKWPTSIVEKLGLLQKKEDVAIQAELPVADEGVQTGDGIVSTESENKLLAAEPAKVAIHEKPKEIKEEIAIAIPKEPARLPKTAKSPVKSEIKAKKPLLSYGWGNNHPAVPENFMKTFNVSVPAQEIFPSTLERVYRGKTYEETLQKGKEKSKATQPSTQSVETALKQYLEAKKRLEKVQSNYRTEYQREFVNWGDSVRRIEATVNRGPAGLPSDWSEETKKKKAKTNKSIPDEAPKKKADKPDAESTSIQTTVENTKEITTSPVKPSVMEKSLSPIKPSLVESSVSPIHQSSSETQTISPTLLNAKKVLELLNESDNPTKALEALPPAGISEQGAHDYKEKRHFPAPKAELQELWQELETEVDALDKSPLFKKIGPPTKEDHSGRILKFDAEPPTTWRLAQDLLDRAHKRSQKLEQDLKVEDVSSH